MDEYCYLNYKMFDEILINRMKIMNTGIYLYFE